MDEQQARDEIDAELLRQLREGELGRAWEAIEKEYGEVMLQTARAKLGFLQIDARSASVGAWSATDVVQQVIAELMNRGPQLADAINGPIKPYLLGAVRKRVLTAFDKRREVLIDQDNLAEHPDDIDLADLVVDDIVVAAMLEPLDDRDRYLVEQTVLHARKNADVARDLDLTGQGVGKAKKRVLAKMAARIAGEDS